MIVAHDALKALRFLGLRVCAELDSNLLRVKSNGPPDLRNEIRIGLGLLQLQIKNDLHIYGGDGGAQFFVLVVRFS